jgi:hypothetical protein
MYAIKTYYNSSYGDRRIVYHGYVLYRSNTGKKIPLKDLPAAVIAAFQRTYPKATITGIATEMENGKTLYEVESKDGTINRDLRFTDTGEGGYS